MDDMMKRLQSQVPRDYLVFVVSVTLVLVFSIVLSISALIKLTALDNVRCWPAVGESFADGFSLVQLSTGRGIGGNGFVDYAIEYVLPEGSLERVQLHGPIVLGEAPAATPVALTICGDVTACGDLETETCLREGKPAGCGRIARQLRTLGPHDVPVQPGARIVELSAMLEDHPQRFYINVTSTSKPNGAHRGFIGPLCQL